MGDPVEELREAVEMLNNTVRERGRSQSHDQAIQELLSKVKGAQWKNVCIPMHKFRTIRSNGCCSVEL